MRAILVFASDTAGKLDILQFNNVMLMQSAIMLWHAFSWAYLEGGVGGQLNQGV